MKIKLCFSTLVCGLLFSQPAFSQTIPVVQLDSSPQIDGNAGDWQAYKAVDIPLAGDLNVHNISVKAGVAGDEVFFLFQWKDSTHDDEHKPYVWDADRGKYSSDKKSEDRFAINFAMEGDFTHDWFSGKTFKADMWHWKAARTNPQGLAHDKLTIITTKKSKKAYVAQAADGTDIYIQRPADEGDKLYKTARYATKEKDTMPKYILNYTPQGSVADVTAKGLWENGQWTLELRRKLDTGNPDDRAFIKGAAISSAISVFDHSGNEVHNISQTFTFQF